MLQKLKNLFKIYDLLTGKSIILNLEQIKVLKGDWYYVSLFAKREKEIVVDEMCIFRLKTKRIAKSKEKALRDYYKLS